MIVKINEIIRCWANYHRTAVARKTFEHLDDWMWTKLQKVAKRRHPKKTPGWCRRKYFGRFHPNRRDKWIFGDKQSGIFVLKFGWFNIERHSKIKGDASPDNPELRLYWKQRQGNRDKNRAQAQLTGLKRSVALRQNCRCPICYNSIFNGEEYHLHHRIPKSEGGKDTINNLVYVHLYCHQKIHGKSG